ncbi:MAG: ABC transporter permease [Bosea sp. (in: a-proteobacteria)]
MSTQSIALTLIPASVLAAGAFLPQTRRMLDALVIAAFLLIAAVFFAAGTEASRLGAMASPIARTSLGSGFWVMVVTATLILADTLSRAGHAAVKRLLAGGAAVLPVAAMIGSGHLDDLSVMKEYANKADVFWQAVGRHIVIVVGALLPTLLLGVPLGVLAFRRSGLGGNVLASLNVIQTIPSIALFGLLMAPLSALALAVPVLGAAGISGIGLAPAIFALTLYSLLPIVRNTSEGLAQVPRHVADAARGMGMTDRQILWQVQVPLALPVFLSGLRVTLVQAIGLAAIAALIGAGGLGSIMFQGLFANALDLVLLGAVPIVMMVVVVDALFRIGVDKLNGVVR